MAANTRTRTYAYEAVDTKGNRSKGQVDALSEAAAASILRQRGDMPLVIEATGSGKGMRREIKMPGGGKRVTLKDLSIFSRQFATLVSSGMSLLRALGVLADQTVNPALKQAVTDVRIDVEGGSALSEALGRHRKIFPKLMVSLVTAGEAGGFLDRALADIAANFEKDSELRGKIKAALTYPAIVLAFSFVLIGAVLIFIVPIFEDMFAQLGGELPLITQLIVTASHNMVWAGPLFVTVVVGGTLLFRRRLESSESLRLSFDRFKLKMPVFGRLLQKLAMARFARNLATLLHSGVPVLNALSVVGGTTGNQVITDAMADLQGAIREGRPMSAPMYDHWIFPPMVTQMVEVGEETGEISQMLDKIADFYDREVDSATESLTASIEPIMVLVMGVLVGGMIICLYLPMFTIYQNIQQ
ncbi:type II secretion system protein F [Pilimelia terevasa]|uniref:Type II secretion system protein F n=1 Tax=Pilimelia terevasa TaxID=53372 RepID=A0A8J3BRN2_9ACTN|nr:type II secretion system F family protein [Pilimelia terevasa]GGK28571.1 type II secretion system protein F [Pilimelia terevasa]